MIGCSQNCQTKRIITMKRIIATTAVAMMLGTSAFASDANTSANTMLNTYAAEQPGDIFASEFIGMRIYSAEKEWNSWDNGARVKSGANADWDDIGEIDDVIFGEDGQVKAVILGVGGFIGIGEKDIAVPMDQIKTVYEGEGDDYFLVVSTNKETLTNAEPFQRAEDKKMAAGNTESKENSDDMTAKTVAEPKAEVVATESADSSMNEKDEVTTGSVSDDEAAWAGRDMLTRPKMTHDGFNEANYEELTAEQLEDARVYGLNDEDVGEIDRLVLSEDGKIKTVVIDVGGFLGLGEHPVGVTMDELQILRDQNGSVRVYIDSTEEALERQPAYRS
ncbi:PRC-barrel domain-containing protein [Hoeflea sp. WL0058]|uniref:PRC-barrel domain-containing protein n=1 Tax=Flavimaribacter sediminis TaxID=2865987 RepID=A0AAE2ZKJ1_9HYPH|nr:PRC-barrel domain-containing protein [Flavimaribacter sediminis]MBW8636676.1 PRC-barrel domain-containing protein [Flavimaribacter sediminis]